LEFGPLNAQRGPFIDTKFGHSSYTNDYDMLAAASPVFYEFLEKCIAAEPAR